ncbi:MAG: ABC transporter permease [Huintestinicola sp.]
MKLGNLLKKELKELITPQALFAMIFTCVLLICMGQFMGGAMEEAFSNSEVNVYNMDDSDFTAKMLTELENYGTEPNIVDVNGTEYSSEMERLDISTLVIIPEGFGASVENGSEAVSVECISLINKGGLSGMMSDISASALTSGITEYVRDYIESQKIGMTDDEKTLIAEPVLTVEYTTANGRTAKVSSTSLASLMMTQNMMAPIVVFFLLLMASQMIMTAISTEKIDKTLETLLSAPVSRVSVLTAKMIAALIVALLNAAFMIVGFVFYIQGIMGNAMSGELAAAQGDAASAMTEALNISEAMTALGLTLSPGSIVLFGIQLFLTIAIGLSASLILGAMATDVKSVQTLVLPIMITTLIPFFVTMFSDVNSLSPLFKTILYIIPFTHTYTALSNIMFGHMGMFWAGLAYQLVFFIVCMFFAVKMFTTDRLFTMTFNPVKTRKKKGIFGGKDGGNETA